MRATYATLQLRPDAFVPLLLGEIGFAAVVPLYPPPAVRPDGSRVTGFEQRPIYAFLKKVPVPAPLPGSSPAPGDPVGVSEHAESAANGDGIGDDNDDDDAPEEIPFVMVREPVQSEAAAAAPTAAEGKEQVPEAVHPPPPPTEGKDKNEI